MKWKQVSAAEMLLFAHGKIIVGERRGDVGEKRGDVVTFTDGTAVAVTTWLVEGSEDTGYDIGNDYWTGDRE
jgi:hypothetical protein